MTKKPTKSPVVHTLPDIASMEAYAAAHSPEECEAALYKAQDMTYEAHDRTTARGRKAMAMKALAACPLCADAFNILALEERDPHVVLDLYERALKAGELALGPDGFRDFDGEFWGFLETRPYMRARHGLALTLLVLGEDDAAVDHMRAMLSLNPDDNQGIRYLLLARLLSRGDDKGVDALLAEYGDEWSIQWLYTKALIAYRKNRRATKATLKLLQDALEANKHVAEALARIDTAATPRGLIRVGGPEEAMDYAEQFGAAWRSTNGAIEWLGMMQKKHPSASDGGARL